MIALTARFVGPDATKQYLCLAVVIHLPQLIGTWKLQGHAPYQLSCLYFLI